jgi:hypothetical protein
MPGDLDLEGDLVVALSGSLATTVTTCRRAEKLRRGHADSAVERLLLAGVDPGTPAPRPAAAWR